MEISKQVIEVLNEVAGKLGVAAEYLYPVLLKQARIDGIVGIMSIFGYLIAALGLAFLVMYLVRKIEDMTGEFAETMALVGITIGGILSLFLLIVFIIELLNLEVYITALLNPDWYILEKLLMQIVK